MQEEAWYTGRIVGDGEGRLDVAALQLEGGLAASQGHRVRLDMSQLPDFRVFPGQARPGLSETQLGRLAASQGHRVRLDVSQLPDFHVFLGQARPSLAVVRSPRRHMLLG